MSDEPILLNRAFDYEAAFEAYIAARVTVAAKLITGTPMEPEDEAKVVVLAVLQAALSSNPSMPTVKCSNCGVVYVVLPAIGSVCPNAHSEALCGDKE